MMWLIHGDFQVDVEGNLINVTLKGAFNEHAVIKLSEKIKSIIEAFDGKPFTIIINALSFEGATPEAYLETNQHNKWLNEKNMLGKAIVHISKTLMAIDITYKKEIPGQNTREFSTLREAKNWVTSLK